MENVTNTEFEYAYSTCNSIVNEVKKVISGKDRECVMLLCALISGGHVLIEDVPGVGKTTLASALSRAAGLDFRRAQFTPDVMASDITGFNMYNKKTESFEYREGLVNTNILLADEINRASPKTQSSLLEAMEERSVTVDGVTYEIPSPFMVIATQNPSGYVGTFPLPEAQLDRFALRLTMGYPSPEDELAIIKRRKTSDPMSLVSPVSDCDSILRVKRACENVYISDKVSEYIVALVNATRSRPEFALGASPRASLALMRLSRAVALTSMREYVLPKDVAELYIDVLSHRVVLSREAKVSGVSAKKVLTDILSSTQVPFIENEK
ncbi:MAG: MoxR family ATPase [Ruminococcaceae bacterium]|nr:MoxR family ATPase [Oscillospiraceae bacterium]